MFRVWDALDVDSAAADASACLDFSFQAGQSF